MLSESYRRVYFFLNNEPCPLAFNKAPMPILYVFSLRLDLLCQQCIIKKQSSRAEVTVLSWRYLRPESHFHVKTNCHAEGLSRHSQSLCGHPTKSKSFILLLMFRRFHIPIRTSLTAHIIEVMRRNTVDLTCIGVIKDTEHWQGLASR